MPGIFTFGISNPFNFTFRARPKPNESDSGASNGAKALVLSPMRDTGKIGICGTLAKLPIELRFLVYKNVLRCEYNIRHANDFLGPNPPIMAEEAKHIEAIDSALLRTCRTIYGEAITVLYGKNRFHFYTPSEIQHFGHARLENKPFGCYCVANRYLTPGYSAPYGRLTMIHNLNLRIGFKPTGNVKDIHRIWSSWCNFFYSPEGQDQLVGFPALRRLALDFTDWGLKPENASKLRVCRPDF